MTKVVLTTVMSRVGVFLRNFCPFLIADQDQNIFIDDEKRKRLQVKFLAPSTPFKKI